MSMVWIYLTSDYTHSWLANRYFNFNFSHHPTLYLRHFIRNSHVQANVSACDAARAHPHLRRTDFAV